METPCGAEATRQGNGIPFGFAQGRLSTPQTDSLCESVRSAQDDRAFLHSRGAGRRFVSR
jgi:hypothetical protein